MAIALFPMGSMYITPGALAACQAFSMPPKVLLARHVTGDWADMSKDDQKANQHSIHDGSRVFSTYKVGTHRFFVITEADRSSTTILLAEEY